jgi:cell division protein FtsB
VNRSAPADPRPPAQNRGVAPDQGRSAVRPAGTRRPAAPGAARRANAPQPHRFTGRATVLGLVLGTLLLAYAYPVRIYLEQQSRIAALEASQAAQRERISGLTDESAKWQDPTFVASQATKTLQMVKPGSTAISVSHADPSAPADTDPDAGRARDTGPWYGQLWSSLQAADKPRPAP